jgi:DNA-binding LytR/AlgR family response regulator
MDHRLITTLIVDDEPVARRVLREGLESIPGIEIAGEAADGREALRQIASLKPDLVFLDLQMPVMSGFEVVRSLREPPLPVIVIVTAFDQHAIQAFEAGAIDYLLKPVTEARLQKSVERAAGLLNRPIEIANQVAGIANVATPEHPTRIRKVVGRSGSDYVVAPGSDSRVRYFCRNYGTFRRYNV